MRKMYGNQLIGFTQIQLHLPLLRLINRSSQVNCIVLFTIHSVAQQLLSHEHPPETSVFAALRRRELLCVGGFTPL